MLSAGACSAHVSRGVQLVIRTPRRGVTKKKKEVHASSKSRFDTALGRSQPTSQPAHLGRPCVPSLWETSPRACRGRVELVPRATFNGRPHIKYLPDKPQRAHVTVSTAVIWERRGRRACLQLTKQTVTSRRSYRVAPLHPLSRQSSINSVLINEPTRHTGPGARTCAGPNPSIFVC